MTFSAFEELSTLKDSEPLLEKIEEIKTFIEEKGGESKPTPFGTILLEDSTLKFGLSVTIPFRT